MAKLPGAMIIQAGVLRNHTFKENVIIIADEIEDVQTEGATLLAFSSAYKNITLGKGTKGNHFHMFFRRDTQQMNLGFRALQDSQITVTFVCENPRQTFLCDGTTMNCTEFAAWWTENKVGGKGTKSFSPLLHEIPVSIMKKAAPLLSIF